MIFDQCLFKEFVKQGDKTCTIKQTSQSKIQFLDLVVEINSMHIFRLQTI